MDPIRIIADYYKNVTGKEMTKESTQEDIELAITRATVGMEFKAQRTSDQKKQEKYVQLWKKLKKLTYGTVRDSINNEQPGI